MLTFRFQPKVHEIACKRARMQKPVCDHNSRLVRITSAPPPRKGGGVSRLEAELAESGRVSSRNEESGGRGAGRAGRRVRGTMRELSQMII